MLLFTRLTPPSRNLPLSPSSHSPNSTRRAPSVGLSRNLPPKRRARDATTSKKSSCTRNAWLYSWSSVSTGCPRENSGCDRERRVSMSPSRCSRFCARYPSQLSIPAPATGSTLRPEVRKGLDERHGLGNKDDIAVRRLVDESVTPIMEPSGGPPPVPALQEPGSASPPPAPPPSDAHPTPPSRASPLTASSPATPQGGISRRKEPDCKVSVAVLTRRRERSLLRMPTPGPCSFADRLSCSAFFPAVDSLMRPTSLATRHTSFLSLATTPSQAASNWRFDLRVFFMTFRRTKTRASIMVRLMKKKKTEYERLPRPFRKLKGSPKSRQCVHAWMHVTHTPIQKKTTSSSSSRHCINTKDTKDSALVLKALRAWICLSSSTPDCRKRMPPMARVMNCSLKVVNRPRLATKALPNIAAPTTNSQHK
mmetsp:Transcript_8989/g.23555  ORF Transcript_8989/g.23555 Transcript_8989/m.23555 type:complete len:423 (+) Transcript_8989:2367-3635(+)